MLGFQVFSPDNIGQDSTRHSKPLHERLSTKKTTKRNECEVLPWLGIPTTARFTLFHVQFALKSKDWK
jgi:hypothetical protein